MTIDPKDIHSDAAARTVSFVYQNHKGETARRRVLPVSIHWGKTKWHPDEQWLLVAIDLDKGKLRTFALSEIMTGSWTRDG